MDESKIKHLEFIQNAITRMANNSFMFKGWAITLVVAIITCSGTLEQPFISFASFLPIILFWLLDSYFLQNERKYRSLFNQVITDKQNISCFSMQMPKSTKTDKTLFVQAMMSKTILWFYLILSIATIIAFLLIKFC